MPASPRALIQIKEKKADCQKILFVRREEGCDPMQLKAPVLLLALAAPLAIGTSEPAQAQTWDGKWTHIGGVNYPHTLTCSRIWRCDLTETIMYDNKNYTLKRTENQTTWGPLTASANSPTPNVCHAQAPSISCKFWLVKK